MSTSRSPRGFDLIDALKKEWAKQGTAGYKMILQDKENGEVYEMTGDFSTDLHEQATIVGIRPLE